MITGHSSAEMMDHYTHFDVSDLKEIADAQKVLVGNVELDEEPDPEVLPGDLVAAQLTILSTAEQDLKRMEEIAHRTVRNVGRTEALT
jgi:hypothetical protein